MRRREFLVTSGSALGALGALGCGGPLGADEPVAGNPRIEVVDLMPAFFAFCDTHRDVPDDAFAAGFVERIVGAHPEVFASRVIGAAGADDAGFSERVERWVPWLREVEPVMRRLHADFSLDLDAARARFVEALPDFDWRGRVYLFASVDAFNGAGRMVAGEPALLFGLDVIARLQADANLTILFHHELFHMYQAQARTYLAEAMWVEGLATYASLVLSPGAADAEALPVSHVHDPDDPQLAAPERAVSLAAVMPALVGELGPMLRARLRSREGDGSEEDYPMFFLGRAAPSLGRRPVRSAYWFGLEIVRRIHRGRSLRELAAIEPETLVDDMARALDAMIERSRS
ncbi:MAG: hypothetical protein KF729_31440 [Sandaracinaceae bacterium]|nr:hypothetical protein [Sandaracinaceae bacterium]